jgi:polysaccharide pyruvyl transferase WcaK-like protein
VASDEYIVDDIISLLSVLKGLITTRYHAVVLSSCSAIPMIAVSSDTRCEAVFRELDIMDLYVDYVKHPEPRPHIDNLDERLIEMTRSMISREEELKGRIAAMHPVFVERAQRNVKILSQWLDQHFPRP